MKSREIKKFRKTYKDYSKGCYFEGFKLAVLFDEKDEVKGHGARWDKDERIWWMPLDCLTTDVHAGIGTVANWLNDHKMIVGQYGKFNENEHNLNLFNTDKSATGNWTEYGLHKSNNEPQFKVQFFYDQDVVKFIPTGMGELASEYLTLEDGRKRWDESINAGYNRVEKA
jgi:hypothetical protein